MLLAIYVKLKIFLMSDFNRGISKNIKVRCEELELVVRIGFETRCHVPVLIWDHRNGEWQVAVALDVHEHTARIDEGVIFIEATGPVFEFIRINFVAYRDAVRSPFLDVPRRLVGFCPAECCTRDIGCGEFLHTPGKIENHIPACAPDGHEKIDTPRAGRQIPDAQLDFEQMRRRFGHSKLVFNSRGLGEQQRWQENDEKESYSVFRHDSLRGWGWFAFSCGATGREAGESYCALFPVVFAVVMFRRLFSPSEHAEPDE